MLKQLLILLLILAVTSSGTCTESSLLLESGPEIGSTIASFYVRAVTGPQAGKSVCYVCRNGDRPVVMIFLREISADSTSLLKQLDATVNKHRAQGLRCFVVLFSDASQRDFARLQTLAFDEKLDIPLTLATESIGGPITKSIAPEAAITVVLYDDLTVTKRYAYRAGECDDPACQSIIKSAEKMANDAAKSIRF